MKKVISLMLVLGLGVLLAAGCASTSSSSGTTSVSETSAAANVGTSVGAGVSMDNSVLGVVTSTSVSGSGAKASTATTPQYGSDGWWSYTDTWTVSSYTYDYTVKFRVWDAGAAEVTTMAGLQALNSASDISEISIFATSTITISGSGSYTVKCGTSTSDPMTYNYATGTVNGPLIFTTTYGSETFEMTYTYSSVSVSASGYPNGTVSLVIKSNGAQVATADIVFNGTNTCTVQFAGAYTGKYSVDIDTGVATLL